MKKRILVILQVNFVFFQELFTELKKDPSLARYNAKNFGEFAKLREPLKFDPDH